MAGTLSERPSTGFGIQRAGIDAVEAIDVDRDHLDAVLACREGEVSMPQVGQNWWRMRSLLNRYCVVAPSPFKNVVLARGANAITQPSRWQREQLQTIVLSRSSAVSNCTAWHWQEPR